jgi:hypothetical protein
MPCSAHIPDIVHEIVHRPMRAHVHILSVKSDELRNEAFELAPNPRHPTNTGITHPRGPAQMSGAGGGRGLPLGIPAASLRPCDELPVGPVVPSGDPWRRGAALSLRISDSCRPVRSGVCKP